MYGSLVPTSGYYPTGLLNIWAGTSVGGTSAVTGIALSSLYVDGGE